MNENSPALNEPRAASSVKFFDKTALIIIGCFVLLALVLVGIMLPGYRHSRNSAQADRAFARHEYAEAIPYLKRIIDRYPDAWMRIKMLGDCYLLSSDDPKVAAEAQKCYLRVQSSPGYQETMSSTATPIDLKTDYDLNEELGICASKMGDEKKAQEYFSKVLARAPDSPAANYYLGVQNFNAGNLRLAARCFQNAATGDQALAPAQMTSEGTSEGPKPSKWGNHWDKLAEPYRRKIAGQLLAGASSKPAIKGTN